MLNFNELELKPEILRAIEDMGFETMTPIQQMAIPVALLGRDVIGQAQTGTGKTAAFSIPFLQQIEHEPVIQVLILTPTRELCVQVEKEIYKLGKYLKTRSLAVYGGQEMIRQIRGLKEKPQIIVATPGRLLDHMQRHTISLEHLKFVVLDEADEMLNMGFLEDIEKVLEACPLQRQTMMFSATMRREIKEIANKFMQQPEIVTVKAEELTVPAIEQYYYEVQEHRKFALLCRLLDLYMPEMAMVFGRTKRRVDELTEALQKLGYQAEGLHGDLTQRHRDMVMNKFRNGQLKILVATDVAARGLDITGVTHVINFDLPQEIDSYVHRIGRTGRAGKEGLALTFVEPREFPHLRAIEETIKRKLEKKKAPSLQDTLIKKQENFMHHLLELIQSGEHTEYYDLAETLLGQYDAVDLIAAMLEELNGESNHDKEAEKVKLTAEKPIIIRRIFKKNDAQSRRGTERRARGERKGRNHNDTKKEKQDNHGAEKRSYHGKKEGNREKDFLKKGNKKQKQFSKNN